MSLKIFLRFINSKLQINADKVYESVARKLINRVYFTILRNYSTVYSRYSFFILEFPELEFYLVYRLP